MKSLLFFPFLLSLLLLTACESNRPGPQGELFILSEPANASVEVNGEFIGTTPLSERLPAGELLVAVRREGFHTERFSLTLPENGRQARELNLRPVHGLVLIDSEPQGAAVTLGGVFQGNTPLALHNVRLGEHRARLVLAGFNEKDVVFQVEDRIPRRVSVEMDSNSGRLVITSTPTGAGVFVDGRSEGITPLSIERVPQGERDIRLQLAGYEPYQTALRITPDDTSRVDATLRPQPGALEVVTIPTGSRIYVNDEFRGESPVLLERLTPGAYVIRAERRGYADEARTVRVGRGESLVEEFRMERNSGTLEIITRPADVRVIIDGEYMGTTRARGTDVISEPLQVDLLSQGAHTLQLVREGYVFENKRFMIVKDEVTALEETLRRIFIPNTVIRVGTGQDQAITGRLHRRHPNGDVELEVREGIFRTFSANDIRSIEPLRQEERLEEE
ncbi:MAG: PEGA domain-containing protein [Verrucomicrobia bacterium]|nr:PEGA domain-containing protein [Verrucomicrobiota bacterium]MCH8528486.1 PEGA domain-containing protein [Kiritimatiellia bacterium]